MGARGDSHSEQSRGGIIQFNKGAKKGEVKIRKATAHSENVLLI